MKICTWIYLLSCWCLGAFFIYSGTVKLPEPEIFAALIGAYGIIPEELILPVAVVLPVLEILIGLGLILNIRGSLTATAVLLLLFVAILTYGIWMELDVDCGCFGPQDPEADAFHGLWQALYRDLTMLAGIALMFGLRRYHAIPPTSLTALIKNHVIIKRRREDVHV